MRVGRSAIDEDAIRLIEEHNPDVQFDWPRILKQAPDIKTVDADADAPRSRTAERQERPADRRSLNPPRRTAGPVIEPVIPPSPEPVPNPDIPEASEPNELDNAGREAAAFQRLGAEALARLRARYAEIMARIAERQVEDAERDELKRRAERLNPDNWVTDADVDEGLEQYEAVYETIRAVVGHARRRR